jgi:hypothetical protein
MGMILKARYEQIGKELGPAGRMKLAMLTKISSIKAADIEDSAGNLKLVDEAIAQIRRGA